MRGVVFAMVLVPVMIDERPVSEPPSTAVWRRLMEPGSSWPLRPHHPPWVHPVPPWAGDPGIFIPPLSPEELAEPADAIRKRPEVIPLAFGRTHGIAFAGIP